MDGSPGSFQQWLAELPPQMQRAVFWGSVFSVGVVVLTLFSRTRRQESRFQSREHEQVRSGAARLASSAKHSSQAARPLLLPGARLDAPPHELLGVARNASAAEIQKAYRAQMLRYHPDRMNQSGGVSAETQKAAAAIAQALTDARDALLKRER